MSRRTPYPPGGELPREYSRTYDPFVALAAAAASTRELLLATGICLVIERDPIITAKEVASLDRLSGGRFLFGVGAGWNIEEMENHGTDPRRRFSLMRERIEAMKAIWTQDEASYHGEQVDFDPIWSLAEADPGAPPSGARRRKRRAGARPSGRLRRRVDAESRPGLRERIEELNRLAEEAGRGPIPVTLSGAKPDPPADRARRGGRRSPLHLLIEPADAGETERRLDELAGTLGLG